MDPTQLASLFKSLNLPGEENKLKPISALKSILITSSYHNELFRLLMPILISLKTSQSNVVKLFLLDVIERACINDIYNLGIDCINVLDVLLNDNNNAVISKSCLIATILYNFIIKTLYYLPINNWSPSINNIYALINNIKIKVISLLYDNNMHESVRSSSLKFIENIILLHSHNEKPLPYNPFMFTPVMNIIIPDVLLKSHTILNYNILLREADSLMDQLLNLFQDADKSNLNCSNICSILISIVLIAMHRPQYVTKNFEAIFQFQSNPPAKLTRSHSRRVQHSLKLSLIAFLKTTTNQELVETIITCLKKMGFEDDVKLVKKILAKKFQSIVEANAPIQEVEQEETGTNVEPVWGGIAPRNVVAASKTVLAQISSMPPNVVASLVVKCMDNYDRGFDTIPNEPNKIMPLNLAIFQGGQPLDLNKLSFIEMSDQLNVAINIHKLLATKRQFPFLPPSVCADGVEAAQKYMQKSGADEKGSKGDSQLARAIPLIPVPTLTGEMCRDLAKQSMFRMITGKIEKDLEHEGRNKLIIRNLIMSKMAVLVPEDEDDSAENTICTISPSIPTSITALLSYLFESPSTRYDAAISLFFTLYSQDLNSEKPILIEDIHSRGQVSSSLRDLVVKSDTKFPNYDLAVLRFLVAIEKKLPAGDKLWLTLINDIPQLPKQIFEFLGKYCGDNDRRVNGMIALRDIMIYHPKYRQQAFQMLLDFTIDDRELVRSAAIRMVMNKIITESIFTNSVTEFAYKQLELLRSHPVPEIAQFVPSTELMVTEKIAEENSDESVMKMAAAVAALGVAVPTLNLSVVDVPTEKVEITVEQKGDVNENIEDFGVDFSAAINTHDDANVEEDANAMEVEQSENREEIMKKIEEERVEYNKMFAEESEKHIRRHILLYLALCLKDVTKFAELFDFYSTAPKGIKKVIHSQIAGLIARVGLSTELLTTIKNASHACDKLIIQILTILTDTMQVVASDVVVLCESLYASRNNDVNFLVPVLAGLKHETIYKVLPQFIDLPIAQLVVEKLSIAVPPVDLLVALHTLDPSKDGISIKKIRDATGYCFIHRNIYTQEVLASVLQKLVDRNPVPILFMRTLIQTLVIFPKLNSFAMSLLSRLISKKVWESPQLWEGWCKAIEMTQPLCYQILLQLPVEKLNDVLTKYVSLKNGLKLWVKTQPRSRIPRQYLVAMGLEVDDKVSSSKHTSSTDVDDTKTKKAKI